MSENQICQKCGISRPIEQFQLMKPKDSNYYKHLYPLNPSQNRVVRANLSKTGDDSEEFILKVMNDVLFKPDDWGKCYYDLRICGVGYVGSAAANIHSIAYQKWKDMLYRCYSGRYKDYDECTVCEEWHSYSNSATGFVLSRVLQ